MASTSGPVVEKSEQPQSSVSNVVNDALSEDPESSNSSPSPSKMARGAPSPAKGVKRTIRTRARKDRFESEENEENDEEEEEEREKEEEEQTKKKKSSAAANNSSSGDARIHVGGKFQATIPAELNDLERWKESEEKEKEYCFWKCAPNVDEAELNSYLEEAAVYHLTIDKALFILQSCCFDFNVAIRMMKKQTSVGEDWNEDDVILFKQAFQLFGKNFSKIRQALPHRPLSSIIQHYYSVKKQWKQRSFIQEKQAENTEETSDDEHEYHLPIGHCSGEDGKPTAEHLLEFAARFEDGMCVNCGHIVKSLSDTEGKKMCYACTIYYRSNKSMRPCQFLSTIRDEEMKKHTMCPPDMLEVVADFAEFAASGKICVEEENTEQDESPTSTSKPVLTVFETPKTKSDQALDSMHREVTELKVACVRMENRLEKEEKELPDVNKQMMKDVRKDNRVRLVHTWSESDKFSAFHCLIRYKLDFRAVSEVLRTKSPEMVRLFYADNKQRIDKCISDVAETGGEWPVLVKEERKREESEDSSSSLSTSSH